MTKLQSHVLRMAVVFCLAWGWVMFAKAPIAAQHEHPPVESPEVPNAGGAITGRVTDVDTTHGIAFTRVSIERVDQVANLRLVFTNASGFFTLTNVLTGVYALSFAAPLPYRAERYDNAPRAAPNPSTLIAVTSAFTATNINAALRKGFVITGTVTDEATGDPLSNVTVMAERGDGTSFGNLSTQTLGDGQYTLGPLQPAQYRLRFVPAPNDLHAIQWHANAKSYAAAVPLNLTNDQGDVNATLAYGSAITGSVTDVSGAPVAGVSVSIFPAGVVSPTFASATSGADGQFVTSPGLAPGAYQAFFATPNTSPYVDEWYGDAPSQFNAALITVTAGLSTTNINLQLGAANGGGITGLLLADDTGAILTGTVGLYRGDQLLDSVRTDQGVYTFTSLSPGAYKLHFAADAPSPYAFAFLGGGADLASSALVNVSAGLTTTNVNQALPRAGSYEGIVTSGGKPLSGVWIIASGPQTYATYSGPDGKYRFASLRHGTYRVSFSPPAPYIAMAESVSIGSGMSTISLGIELAEGGRITGTVLAQDTHAPMSGATVRIENTTAPFTVTFAYADKDGNFTSPGLPSGNYRVLAQPGPYWGHYLGSSTTAAVSAPNTTPNIALAPARGGTLSGFVCGGDGYAIPASVTVSAFNATTGQLVNATSPNTFGFYQLAVSPGSYKVRFGGVGLFTKWYGGATTLASATPITVTGTSEMPNIGTCLSAGPMLYLPLVRR